MSIIIGLFYDTTKAVDTVNQGSFETSIRERFWNGFFKYLQEQEAVRECDCGTLERVLHNRHL